MGAAPSTWGPARERREPGKNGDARVSVTQESLAQPIPCPEGEQAGANSCAEPRFDAARIIGVPTGTRIRLTLDAAGFAGHLSQP
jgi:hypothetical protein